jgi:hypothetical protein
MMFKTPWSGAGASCGNQDLPARDVCDVRKICKTSELAVPDLQTFSTFQLVDLLTF